MISLEVQNASRSESVPDAVQFQRWVEAALAQEEAELVIRIVDEEESARLNARYRHRQSPTNVLSFPFEMPEEIPMNFLGDLVICAPVVEREAKEQGKGLQAHWAHMVIHGVLHLVGLDHLTETEAIQMETEEIHILHSLGFSNPYEEDIKS